MAKKEQLSFEDLVKGLQNSNLKMNADVQEQLKIAQEQIKNSENEKIVSEGQAENIEKLKKDQDEVIKVLKAGLLDKTGEGLNSNVIKLIKQVNILSSNIKTALKPTKKSDLSETDIENSKVQNDQLDLLAKIEENTRASSVTAAPEEAQDSGGGLFSNIGSGIKKLGSGMSGTAKNLLAFSAALFITAKALQQFAKVEWTSIAKGALAITGLALAAKMAGDGDAYKSILALGVAVVALAYGLTKFADVEWSSILKGSAALFVLAKAAEIAGDGDAYKSILALGVGTIALAYGLSKFADVSWGDVLTGTVAMFALAKAAEVADSGDASKTILALGVGTLALAYGMDKFGDVSWGDVITGTVAMFALAAAAKLAGSGDAYKSILALGVGTLALAFGFKKFGEVGWGEMIKGIAVITALGFAVKMAGDSKSALAFLALGASVWVIADAFEKFAALDWGSLMKGVAVIGLLGIGLAALSVIAVPILITASAFLVFGAALWVIAEAFETVAESMPEFTDGLQRLADIGGASLFSVAAGIVAVGAALAVFGAAQMVTAMENLVTRFLSLGDDTPVEQLEKIGKAGPGIEKAATGLERLAAAMKAFADVDEDALDAAVEAAEDIADAFDEKNVTINLAGPAAEAAKPAAQAAPATGETQPAPAQAAPQQATPVKKAPMTNPSPTVTTESVSGELKGVTADQIKGHPNYKKHYDQAIKEGLSPIEAAKDATDEVKADMVKQQKVNPQQVTPAAPAANNVYGKSAEVAAADKQVPLTKSTNVVNAPTQVNNQTQTASFKRPIRNEDNTLTGWLKNKFS